MAADQRTINLNTNTVEIRLFQIVGTELNAARLRTADEAHVTAVQNCDAVAQRLHVVQHVGTEE